LGISLGFRFWRKTLFFSEKFGMDTEGQCDSGVSYGYRFGRKFLEYFTLELQMEAHRHIRLRLLHPSRSVCASSRIPIPLQQFCGMILGSVGTMAPATMDAGQCGIDRPGFGVPSVAQKLRAINDKTFSGFSIMISSLFPFLLSIVQFVSEFE
jgi:hypothetical protein